MQTVHFRKIGVFKHRPGDFEHIKERQDFNSERSIGVHPCISSVNTHISCVVNKTPYNCKVIESTLLRMSK